MSCSPAVLSPISYLSFLCLLYDTKKELLVSGQHSCLLIHMFSITIHLFGGMDFTVIIISDLFPKEEVQ